MLIKYACDGLDLKLLIGFASIADRHVVRLRFGLGFFIEMNDRRVGMIEWVVHVCIFEEYKANR